jgi:hypothetical protein
MARSHTPEVVVVDDDDTRIYDPPDVGQDGPIPLPVNLASLVNVYHPLEVALPQELAQVYANLTDPNRVSDSIGMMAIPSLLVRQAAVKGDVQAAINALTAAGGQADEIIRLRGLLALNYPGLTEVPASGLTLTPSTGLAGQVVTIGATAGLGTTTVLSWGSLTLRVFTVDSDVAISVVVPWGTGVVPVSVTGAGGSSAVASYTYA